MEPLTEFTRRVRLASPTAYHTVRQFRREWLPAGLLALVTMLLVSGLAASTLDPAEYFVQDRLFRRRPVRPPENKIVLVLMGESTLTAWPEPTLFWGLRLKSVIERARAAGARVQGLDFIYQVSFDSVLQSRYHVPNEGLPVRALGLAVLPGDVALAQTPQVPPAQELRYLGPTVSDNFGLVSFPTNPDVAIRAAEGYRTDGGTLFPSLAAVMALRGRGMNPRDPQALRSLTAGLPGQPGPGRVNINYLGPPGKVFPVIPAEKVQQGQLSGEERALLRGAYVIIGPSFAAANDQRRGAGSHDYYGAEIHAHTLATLLNRNPIRQVSRAQQVIAAAVMSLAIGLVAIFASFWMGLIIALGLVAGWVVGAVLALGNDQMLPVVGPVFGIALAWTGQTAWRAVAEARRRRELHETFQPFVGPEVLAYLLANPEESGRGGRRRNITVLCAELRGFSHLSSQLLPETISLMLHAYCTEMTRIVFQHGGTLDKFVGDATLAFWNAPQPRKEHAADALRAALDIVAAVEELNARWHAERNLEAGDQVGIRIGVQSGPAVVGNLGADDRLSYTALGPTMDAAIQLARLNETVDGIMMVGERAIEEAVLSVHVEGIRHQGLELAGQLEPINAVQVQNINGDTLRFEPEEGTRVRTSHRRRRENTA